MTAAEPDGCYFSWGDHTCIEDQGHEWPHECSCGVTVDAVAVAKSEIRAREAAENRAIFKAVVGEGI